MKQYYRVPLSLPDSNQPGKPGYVLNPDASLSLELKIEPRAFPMRRRLYCTGELDLSPKLIGSPYGSLALMHHWVDDALEDTVRCNELYSLHLNGHGEKWARSAFIRVNPASLPKDKYLTFSVCAKAEKLKVNKTGEMTVALEIFKARKDRHIEDVSNEPDKTIRITIPDGTYEWRELKIKLRLAKDAVMLVARIEGKNFSGKVWLGSPRLSGADGETVIPPLMPHQPESWGTNWVGNNLDLVNWPLLAMSVDGKNFFNGRIWIAGRRNHDFEVALPEMNPGRHRLEITLVHDYARRLPLRIRTAQILEESARPLEVVWYPKYVPENRDFPVLIEKNGEAPRGKPRGIFAEPCEAKNAIHHCGLPQGFVYSAVVKPLATKTGLAKKGKDVSTLDVSDLQSGSARANPQYELALGSDREIINPRRVVRDGGAPVRLASGDHEYINGNVRDDFLRFLVWYLTNQQGDSILLRTFYKISGTRISDPAEWQKLIGLLNRLQMPYAYLEDLIAWDIFSHPAEDLLKGRYYLGRQKHEQDYMIYSSGETSGYRAAPSTEPGVVDTLQHDLAGRYQRRAGLTRHYYLPLVIRQHDKAYVQDPRAADNMQTAANLFVKTIEMITRNRPYSRHTGASTLFRYLLQGGFEWIGSEQMYGPEEILLISARGASRAYGKKEFGAHLAHQYGSTPCDNPEHAHRLFLSLATAYLQGVTDIHTEDGQWRIEEGHDRFSGACLAHQEVQGNFLRFIQTHPRRGEMHVPIAVLQGRYCGWQGRGRRKVWGSERPEFNFGKPEESFDLLKVFYPRTVLDSIGMGKREFRSNGWYSGTPFGPIDLLPVEAPQAVLASYRTIAFLGWNTFKEKDFKRLERFVRAGGTLLLSRPHLSVNLKRNEPSILPKSKLLNEIMGDALNRNCRSEARVGKGRIIYYGQDSYPADGAIRKSYERDLASAGRQVCEVERERGWVRGNEDVNFAAYDWNGHRTIYLLNIDWWSGRETAKASLLFGRSEFPISVRKGRIEVITLAGDTAVLPEDESADVLHIHEEDGRTRVTIQSDRGSDLIIYRRGGRTSSRLRINEGGVQEGVI